MSKTDKRENIIMVITTSVLSVITLIASLDRQ